jgi:hypothetical protein
MSDSTTKEKGREKMQLEDQYLAQLDETQLKAHAIAKSHLGTSFNLKKSNGFIEWIKKFKPLN